jgi:hypothetical protein
MSLLDAFRDKRGLDYRPPRLVGFFAVSQRKKQIVDSG